MVRRFYRGPCSLENAANKSLKPPGAQCYPRHACALSVSLFMHLHEGPQVAPLLVRQGIKHASFCMQNHAPYACTRNLTPASQKKSPFLMTGRERICPWRGRASLNEMTEGRFRREGVVPGADDNHIRAFLVLFLTLHTVHENEKI